MFFGRPHTVCHTSLAIFLPAGYLVLLNLASPDEHGISDVGAAVFCLYNCFCAIMNAVHSFLLPVSLLFYFCAAIMIGLKHRLYV